MEKDREIQVDIGIEAETGIVSEIEVAIETGHAVGTDTASVTAAERGTGTRTEAAVGTGTGIDSGTETEFVTGIEIEIDETKEMMRMILEKIEDEKGISQEARSETVPRGQEEAVSGLRGTETGNGIGNGGGMDALLSRPQSRI